jgi:hypothetical protein
VTAALDGLVYRALAAAGEPLNVRKLGDAAGMPTRDTQAALDRLALAGKVEPVDGGHDRGGAMLPARWRIVRTTGKRR